MAVKVGGGTIVQAPIENVWDYITLTERGPLPYLLGGQTVVFEPRADRMQQGMKASTIIEVANILDLGYDIKLPLEVRIDAVHHDDFRFDTSVGGFKFLSGNATVQLEPCVPDRNTTVLRFNFQLPMIAMIVKSRIQYEIDALMPIVGKIITRQLA